MGTWATEEKAAQACDQAAISAGVSKAFAIFFPADRALLKLTDGPVPIADGVERVEACMVQS